MDLSVPPTRTIRWWVIVYAVLVTPISVDRIGLVNAGGPDVIKWGLKGLVWVLPLAVLTPRWSTLLEAFRRPPTMWLMCWASLGLMSVLWAFDPQQAVLIGFSIAGLVVLSTWYVFNNGWHPFATALCIGLTAYLVGGILLEFLEGTLFVERSVGLASGPTTLGRLAAFNLVLSAGIIWSHRSSLLFWVVPIVSVLALLLSETRTALAAAVVGLLYGGLRRLSPLNRTLVLGAVVVGALAVLAGLAAVSPDVASVGERGDPSSFAGRTSIWPIAWELFTERPLLGYGWGASEQLYIEVARSGRLSFIAFTSHSILLAPLIQGGVVGFTLIATVIGSTFYHRNRVDPWVVAPIITLLIGGLTESIIHLPSVAIMLIAGVAAAIASAPRWPEGLSTPVRKTIGRPRTRPLATTPAARSSTADRSDPGRPADDGSAGDRSADDLRL